MTSAEQRRRMWLFLCFAAIPIASFGQAHVPSRFYGVGSPFAVAPVLNAPFSADATFTFTGTLGDGTRIEQRARARYYRDSPVVSAPSGSTSGWVGRSRRRGDTPRFGLLRIQNARTFVMDPSDQTFRLLYMLDRRKDFQCRERVHDSAWQ